MLYVRTLCCCKFVGFYRAVSKEYPSESDRGVWGWETALSMGDNWMEFGGVRSELWAGYLYCSDIPRWNGPSILGGVMPQNLFRAGLWDPKDTGHGAASCVHCQGKPRGGCLVFRKPPDFLSFTVWPQWHLGQCNFMWKTLIHTCCWHGPLCAQGCPEMLVQVWTKLVAGLQ